MKVITKKKLQQPGHLERLFETISIQKSLDHPYIAKIYELFEDSLSYYIIYE